MQVASCLNISEMPSVALNLALNDGRVLSGDILQAVVLLDSNDPDTVIHEFVAAVLGVGRTGWINIHTDKIYETEQEYLNVFLPLCPANQVDTALKPGRHQFSMRVLIPDTAPSSYESQFGSVRYTIKISLVTNAEHSSCTEVFPFIVVSRSSFDEIPQAIMKNIDYRDETDFTVCSLPFGTIYLVISLPRTAFCLGEQIQAKVWVKNGSRKALKDCRLQLLLKAQFEAKSRYEHAHDRKLVEQVVDSWPIGKIRGRTEERFKDCTLKVVDGVVPTQQSTSPGLDPSIIQLSYVLRFNAEPGIESEIPIIITAEGYRNPPDSGLTHNDYDESSADLYANSYGASRSPGHGYNKTSGNVNRNQQKRVSIFECNQPKLYR